MLRFFGNVLRSLVYNSRRSEHLRCGGLLRETFNALQAWLLAGEGSLGQSNFITLLKNNISILNINLFFRFFHLWAAAVKRPAANNRKKKKRKQKLKLG